MCQECKEVPKTKKSECHYLSGSSTRVCLVYLVTSSPSSKTVYVDQVWMLCKYLLRYSFPSTKSTAWENFSSVIYLWLINFLNKSKFLFIRSHPVSISKPSKASHSIQNKVLSIGGKAWQHVAPATFDPKNSPHHSGCSPTGHDASSLETLTCSLNLCSNAT